MRLRRPRVLAALAVTGVLLTGCGGTAGEDGGNGAGTASAGSPSAGSPATESPGEDADATAPAPFPANAEPDTEDASADAFGNVTDIRLGRHDGFDRVVFEFDGEGTPGWDVRYVDQASSQGSGDPIDVAGDAVLQVTLTGMGLPFDTGVEEYSGPRRIEVADTEVVTEVYFDATFEGTTVSFIGTSAETPFRAYLLQDPVRVVVEVADPN